MFYGGITQATRRHNIELKYRQDRVAEAFRSPYAKAAKIATEQGDLKNAEENFRLALLEEPMNAALHDRFAWFLLNRCQRPEEAKQTSEQAVKLDSHNADALLTLALCWYRLGELAKGDDALKRAENKGKPKSLCLLRMGISRYHAVKSALYSKEAIDQLKEGELLIDQAIKSMSPGDRFFAKNMNEARKYKELFLGLQHKIKLG